MNELPRFIFKFVKDGAPPETISTDLPDAAQARTTATDIMGMELREHPGQLWDDQDWHIQVMDDRGLVLFTVYSSVIEAASQLR